MSIISLNLMNSEQRKALFEAWQSQWRLQYFLAVAWSTERHLSTVAWEPNGLVIRRSSGAGHLVFGNEDFVVDQLKQGPLLLHESLLPASYLLESSLSEETHVKQLYLIEKTSILMRRVRQKLDVECESETLTTFVSSNEEVNLSIKVMGIEDYSVSKLLYEKYMKGSLSVQDFQCAAQKGAYSVGFYDGDEQVAVGHIGFEWQGEAFVYGILVSPEYRGRGLGRAMMVALHHEADRRGWHLNLLTDNPIAKALYYEVGYEDAGSMLKISNRS